MSQRPISLSDDLRRLRDEGYDIVILAGFLLLRDVPYVTTDRKVARGTLVSPLTLAGDVTCPPDDHVARFSGETPCDSTGAPLTKIINNSIQEMLAEGLVVNFLFSSRPSGGKYENYFQKMRTYVAILQSHAQAIEPAVTAQTYPVVAADHDSLFEYEDTATSRASIGAITQRLATGSIVIVGLGGTGAYILDLVAKTPAPAIHLYDGDRFSQHNAFRAPGAPSRDDLRGGPNKATYFQALYARMRKQISAHPYYVDASTIEELRGASFVFICIDRNAARRLIVEKLEEFGVSFIDVGMGIPRTDDSLGGIVRMTTSTPAKRSHLPTRVPLSDMDDDNDYNRNIQIADLNALNAALAVIKWKKVAGFYRDDRREHHATYTVAANMLLSEEQV